MGNGRVVGTDFLITIKTEYDNRKENLLTLLVVVFFSVCYLNRHSQIKRNCCTRVFMYLQQPRYFYAFGITVPSEFTVPSVQVTV